MYLSAIAQIPTFRILAIIAMFLSESDIRERLARGDIQIDPPPEANQLAAFAIDLRLGTQFLQAPLSRGFAPIDLAAPLSGLSSSDQSSPITVPLGESFSVSPGVSVIGVTLEYVHMPLDLAGFLFPKTSWERFGLSVGSGTVEPGFQGKLVLILRNSNSVPVLLYPGIPIVRLCLAQISRTSGHEYSTRNIPLPAQIRALKKTLTEGAPRRSREAISTESLAKRFSEVLAATGTAKGKALEDLMADIFTSLDGLYILKRNARLRAEELDLVIKNELTTGFWRLAGSPLIVECKNWSGKVGAREISILVDKLQAVSPDAKTGILVAMNGITGDGYSDAVLKVREARQRGRYILLLEQKDLEDVGRGVSLAQVIERRYEALVII